MSKKLTAYRVTYGGKTVTRRAETAIKAVEKLVNQYGWNWRWDMVDSRTNGKEWVVGVADSEGGINWDMRISACI